MRYDTSPITGKRIIVEDCKLEFDKEELAWCAGFFDGEGCTFYKLKSWNGSKSSFPHIRLTISQTSNAVLHRFRKAVKRGKVEGPYKQSGIANDKYHLTAYAFEDVQYIMCQIWKNLSHRKKDQYNKAVIEYTKAMKLKRSGMKIIK